MKKLASFFTVYLVIMIMIALAITLMTYQFLPEIDAKNILIVTCGLAIPASLAAALNRINRN